MGYRLLQGLLRKMVSQAFGGTLVSPTHRICFGKRTLTSKAAKTACIHNQSDLIGSKTDIPFYPHSRIMDFHTYLTTPGTGFPRSACYDVDLYASVCLHFLMEQFEFWQI